MNTGLISHQQLGHTETGPLLKSHLQERRSGDVKTESDFSFKHKYTITHVRLFVSIRNTDTVSVPRQFFFFFFFLGGGGGGGGVAKYYMD